MIWLKRIVLIFLIICLGTILDYFVHQLDVLFSVPDTYFTHKILYGTLWGFVGYVVFKRYLTTPFRVAFAISIVPAVLLQVLYFIQGHMLPWVVLFFLFIHFLVFLLSGLYVCRKYRDVFIS